MRYRSSAQPVLDFYRDQRFARQTGDRLLKVGFTIWTALCDAAPALTKIAAVAQSTGGIGRMIMTGYIRVDLTFVATIVRIFCTIDGANRRTKIPHFCVYQEHESRLANSARPDNEAVPGRTNSHQH